MSSPRYYAYLLRLRQRKIQGRTVWYIGLENVHSGERIRFSNLHAVMTFLQDKMQQRSTTMHQESLPETDTDSQTLSDSSKRRLQ